jgi:aspartyl-tRNA(Asn)/glutamyl-tRNA(Gln) amidotransferase subunit A
VPDYVAELARPLAGVRIGLPANWFFDDLEADVERAVDEAVARLVNLGARTVNMTLPHMDEAVGAHRAIIFSEASSYYQSHLAAAQQPGQPRFGHEIRPLLEAGLFFPAVDYLKALRMRRTIRAAWSKVFSKVDCLVTPTSPLVATRFGQQTADLPGGAKPLVRAYLDLTLPFNLSGHPAINVPCGLSSDGLPIGMQVVGKPFGEGTILRVAHQFQQATDWHQRRRKDEA